jgi:pSer/pThr/pTyr-binding forkhead associated (FHA) protein
MPPRQYRLTMRKGPMPGKVYDLAKSMLTIGREVKNDIVINDAEVSRLHLRLNETEQGYQVEDQASTNGTFINGQRVNAPTLLRSGDILGLGETIELEYVLVHDADTTVMAGTPQPVPATPVGEPPRPEPAAVSPLPGYTPPPMPVAHTPPYPTAAPEAERSQQWWLWALGIGCGCLAVVGCVIGAALVVYLAMGGGGF